MTFFYSWNHSPADPRNTIQTKSKQGSGTKVVSLIASATDILWALGKGNLQVGRSHECDNPQSVITLPQVTWTKFCTDGRSYEIDKRVKAILQEGLSVYGVDAEKLASLEPDVILTQDHCQVCAVSFDDVSAAVCESIDSEPQIISLHPDTLADIQEDIMRVAIAVGDPDAGRTLLTSLQQRINHIKAKIAGERIKPGVVFIEWIEPLMAGGNWIPELIQIAGGRDLLGKPGKHSAQKVLSALSEVDPDVILIAPCGYTIDRTMEELELLTETKTWNTLRAVAEGKVYIADGNRMFNRPGPSVVDTLEIVAEILHPQNFSFPDHHRWWFKMPC